MKTRAFALRARGYSHIKRGQECQDAALWLPKIAYGFTEAEIIAVADGHGGDDYIRSATGSHLAVTIAAAKIGEFIREATDENRLAERWAEINRFLAGSIIAEWREQVRRHWEDNPFSPEELENISPKARTKYDSGEIYSAYGTTLIAAAMKHGYCFGLQIGDGKCVAVDDGASELDEEIKDTAVTIGGCRFYQPIPLDEKCFLNVTTSLCDDDALNECHYFFTKSRPAAIFIGTDGVDGSFARDEQLYRLYEAMLCSFAPAGDDDNKFNAARDDAANYLPRLSAKGSGDDVSVAAIFDYGKIGQLDLKQNIAAPKSPSRPKIPPFTTAQSPIVD